MFLYASTGLKKESGIFKMGTLRALLQFCLFLAHVQTTIKQPFPTRTFSLDSCLSGSKDDALSGTRFDLWAIVKNAIKNSAQNVASVGSEMSKCCLNMAKSSGVTGAACLGTWAKILKRPSLVNTNAKELKAVMSTPSRECHNFTEAT